MRSVGRCLVKVRGLSKSFDGITVVDDVDLDILAGEIHGLVGPNGCGKSTLIKMLAGYYQPDGGTIESVGDGRQADAKRRLQLSFAHQDLALIPSLSVAENLAIVMGFETGFGKRIRWRANRARAARVIEQYGIRASPDTPVARLAPADAALLVIARAMAPLTDTGPSVIVLDEPTSSLAAAEATRVLEVIRAAASSECGILFVSHRLDEVLEATDRVTVMRDGKVVARRLTSTVSRDELVELMLGREVHQLVRERITPNSGDTLLEIRNIRGRLLNDFSCDVGIGEILGVTGLLGSGKSELGRILGGAERPQSGLIRVRGKEIHIKRPGDAVRAGIAYVPADRRTEGGIATMIARENVTLPTMRAFWARGILRRSREHREAVEWMQRTGTVPLEPIRRFSKFSGGNQQKVVLAKWIRTRPLVLVLDEPTQGVDVGAVHDIHRLIVERAAAGVGILLLSSEWGELSRMCTRVVVLDRGFQITELRDHEVTEENIAAACLGHSAVVRLTEEP